MQEPLYKLIFEGKIQPGFAENTVRKNLQALFKVENSKMQRLFSGAPVVVRKNLPEDKIRQYEKALIKAGAACRILSVDGQRELPATGSEAKKTDNTVSSPVGANPVLSSAAVNPEEKITGKKRAFKPANRLGRIRFLALLWLVGWFEVLAWLLPDYLPQLTGPMTIQEQLVLAAGLHSLAVFLFILIISLRLHDMNRTAWLWLFMLIPGLNLLFLFWLAFTGGTQRWNTYGEVPSEPGNMARLFGFWIPILIVLCTGAFAWFYQEVLLQLANTLPAEIMGFADAWMASNHKG